MPDEPTLPSSDPPPPFDPRRRAGTGLAGETTGSMATGSGTPRSDGGTILPGTARAPEVIGDFEVMGKLGQGGMGAVYRARQRSLDRQVALKILPATLETDADFVARFQREARVAASLSHANLVKVYASGAADGCHYIAMELIEGETLGQWLKRGALPPLEALRITLDVTQALECGWRTAQLIHRDIKPGNIFLSIHGDVKLGDLGLAKTIGGDTTGLTQTGTAMGTPHYISPEQARGDRDIDFRADIYSLGCTLYQMLTGRTPYEGRDPVAVFHQHIHGPPPAILKVLPQCPIPLARLVGKMLKKQRRERHVSYEELIAQIESVRALLDPHLHTPAIPAPATPNSITPATPRHGVPSAATANTEARPPKSHTAVYGGAAVLVLAVAAFFLWPRPEKLTRAQIYAREHAGEKPSEPAPGAAPIPEAPHLTAGSSPKGSSVPLPVITGWQDAMEETKRGLKKFGQADFTEENGWVTTTTRPTSGFAISPQQFTNTAVRGKFRQSLSVFVRDHPANPGGKYNVHFNAEGHGIIDRTDHAEGSPRQDTVLQRFTFPALPEHEFLLTMAGPELRVWLDGEMVSTIHDPAHPQGTPGIGISEVGTAVRDLAVAELPASFASASTPGPTEVWQPLFTDAEWQTGNAKREAKDGMQHLHDTGWRKAQPSPDGAIRARIQFREGARNPAITARHLSQENEYVFALQSDGNFVVLQHHIANQLAILGSLRLSKPLQPGDSIDLELRLQGDHLVGLVNGAVAIDVHDGSGQDAGEWGLGAADGWYESVEVQTLPTPTATAIKLADTQHLDPSAPATGSAAEPWQDILRDPPPPSLSGAVEQTPEGVRFTGPGSIWRGQRQGPHGDGAIRMRATFDGAHVTVRARASNTGTYVLSLDAGKAVRLSRWEETTHSIVISVFPLPSLIQIGQDYDLELRAVGQTLTAKFNGEVLGTVTDGTFAEGNFDVTVTDQLAAPALVKSIAVLNLNPPATADPQPPQ